MTILQKIVTGTLLWSSVLKHFNAAYKVTETTAMSWQDRWKIKKFYASIADS